VSATESLQPAQFPRLFHGSVSELRGTHLVPGQHGGASSAQDEWKGYGQSKHDYVSATDDETKAWHFAHLASAQSLGNTPRPRVYEVEPNAQTKIGVEHTDHPVLRQAFAEKWWKKPQPAGEHVSPQFKVIAQHDTRPGAQGTFPSIDWRKHADMKKAGSVNHPYSARPEYEQHEHEAYREQRQRRNTERAAKKAEPKQQGLF